MTHTADNTPTCHEKRTHDINDRIWFLHENPSDHAAEHICECKQDIARFEIWRNSKEDWETSIIDCCYFCKDTVQAALHSCGITTKIVDHGTDISDIYIARIEERVSDDWETCPHCWTGKLEWTISGEFTAEELRFPDMLNIANKCQCKTCGFKASVGAGLVVPHIQAPFTPHTTTE